MGMKGVLPAVLTPFTAEGTVDVRALEALIGTLYEADIDGLYVCGQTGEGLQQSVEMREQVLETAIRCSPRGRTVMAHVGSARLADAVRLARHASDHGAHAISSLPPSGAYEYQEIRAYYAALAQATPLPLVLYYFPDAAPGLKCEHVVQLCDLPRVSGVKFTSYELHRIQDLTRAGAAVWNGRDEVFAAGQLLGAQGGIGSFYNLVPECFVELYRAGQSGDWQRSRTLQDQINVLIGIVLQFPMIPALKKLLTWSGLPCGEGLPPRRPLTAAEEQALRRRLEEAEFEPGRFLRSSRLSAR